ncbi:hypothetical protein B0H17DRAFT_1222742 [Mycena rosella]|uniref:Uncharacterized protein n=1 Tax=Mycena rosella TaxID=1033263 RepID=A0AAD7AXT2_MYCRO|nr:hypothetical protein B0H17DRAFT_1222742 [Mycena rosella]
MLPKTLVKVPPSMWVPVKVKGITVVVEGRKPLKLPGLTLRPELQYQHRREVDTQLAELEARCTSGRVRSGAYDAEGNLKVAACERKEADCDWETCAVVAVTPVRTQCCDTLFCKEHIDGTSDEFPVDMRPRRNPPLLRLNRARPAFSRPLPLLPRTQRALRPLRDRPSVVARAFIRAKRDANAPPTPHFKRVGSVLALRCLLGLRSISG